MIEAARPPCDRARVFDWNDLRYFLAIARARTFAGAARDLGCEHASVGRRVSVRETALGARLFLRGPDGLIATAAGRQMLPLAEEVAARVEAIERRVSGDDGRIEGTVRVSTSESASVYFVQRFVALRERHPALVVEILSGNHASDLLRGEGGHAPPPTPGARSGGGRARPGGGGGARGRAGRGGPQAGRRRLVAVRVTRL